MLGRYNRFALDAILLSSGAIAGRASFFFSNHALQSGSIAAYLPHLLCYAATTLLYRAGYSREALLLGGSWTTGYLASTAENIQNKRRLGS